MSLTVVGSKKDFEIIWIDQFTRQPRDLDNVTFELYHYEEAKNVTLKAPYPEPYIIAEQLNDIITIGSYNPASGYSIDSSFSLQLNIIVTDLPSLGCPSNEYVVPGTNSKIAIVNGRKNFALSACELSKLINISASGYTAGVDSGFLVLYSEMTGSEYILQIGAGTINPILGFQTGQYDYGTDIRLVYNVDPTPMTRIDTGKYIYLNVSLDIPPYILNERYYVIFRGTDPVTGREEIAEEDFILNQKIINRNYLIPSFI